MSKFKLLGEIFDGLGKPKDILPEPVQVIFRLINNLRNDPEQRYPKDFIKQVSVIDGAEFQ